MTFARWTWVAMLRLGLVALCVGVLGSCGLGGTYYSGVGYPGYYGTGYRRDTSYPYPFAPYSAYYDWFSYGPTYRGPYYHNYPNIEYYVEYRPIYPY